MFLSSAACILLCGALRKSCARQMPKGGNSEHLALTRRCEAYRELINCSLSQVDFGRLYLEGVCLENARRIDNAEVQSGYLARLPAEAEEAPLGSLLNGHASFILATAVGVQGIEAEAAYEATPQNRRFARAEARNLASKLIEAQNISLEVKEVLQQAAAGIFREAQSNVRIWGRTHSCEMSLLR